MQKTNFPFIAIVHDDASTDGSADIIREYAEKYPDIIKPIFETENQYSKRDGSILRIMSNAAKGICYSAYCEGDDYWTDPLKLQKQVDYLEAHPECLLAACHGTLEFRGGKYSTETDYQKLSFPHPGCLERDIPLQELTEKDGRFLLTAGLVFRTRIKEEFPSEFKALPFGDTPLKLIAAMDGTLHYLPDDMVVYRFCSSAESATAKSVRKQVRCFRDIPWKEVVDMYVAADQYSAGKYADTLRVAAVKSAIRFAEHYTNLHSETLRAWKHVFAYRYLKGAPHFHQEQSRSPLTHLLRRILYFPHYPVRGCHLLLCPVLLFFYTPRKDGAAFGLNKLHLFSYTRTKSHICFYFMGVKIFSTARR